MSKPYRPLLINLFAAISLVASALGIAPTCICARADSDAAAAQATIRIVLAGDSTVTDEEGWGIGFKKCLGSDVECLNLAVGGRSSKSFIKEGLWKKCLDAKPDYVLIQFGHNDKPGAGAYRETDLPTYRGFMTQYVDDARAAGIKPVLVTSLEQRE
jgi:lysophospholipase L1-like esterase